MRPNHSLPEFTMIRESEGLLPLETRAINSYVWINVIDFTSLSSTCSQQITIR